MKKINNDRIYDGDPPIIMEDFIREEKLYKKGYTQWLIQGDKFIPIEPTTNKLPKGFYNIQWNDILQKYVLCKRNIILEDLYILPDDNYISILNDIQTFWKSKPIYKKYNYVYKRGILLYGKPGCGKTSLINLLAKDLIDNYNGIIINIKDDTDLYHFDEVIYTLREIEPNLKIIVILEDIDNFLDDKDKELQTKLLNILDGNMQCNNIVILATTNYPEQLEERISNRPSRFDHAYEITLPNDKIRKFYIETKLSKEDLKTIDINKWIKNTNEFTIDHLKELILSVFVLGYDFNISLERIKTMLYNKHIKIKTGNSIPGFKSK